MPYECPLIVLLSIAGYFALLFIIAWLVGRSKEGGNFYGGRKTPWLIAAIASMGAPISGVTFISVPGMVVTKSFSYLQMVLEFVVGFLIIAYVLIPLFYKKKLTINAALTFAGLLLLASNHQIQNKF